MGPYHFQTIDCRRHLNICFPLAQRGNVTDAGWCSACGGNAFSYSNTVFEKVHKICICSAVLSPFAPAGAFRFSRGFIIMNETVGSLRKTWEREILWTSCKARESVQGEFGGKMYWRISLIKNLFSVAGVFLVKVMGRFSWAWSSLKGLQCDWCRLVTSSSFGHAGGF